MNAVMNASRGGSDSPCDINVYDVEVLDRKILRSIVGAHSKVTWEMLYLTNSVLPISSVITARRLLYLYTF